MHAGMRERLVRLEPEQDVIIIGGGINGAGVARDAALRGLRVALFDKDDFAAGTSSRTSKLVHGGVRYLAQGALRLVWEACRERRTLLRTAPHLVRPLPFVFPLYHDSPLPPWQLRAGMWLYDLLAGFRNVEPHRMLHPQRTGRWGGSLRRDGLRTMALYYDATMDDARLVLANVLAARAAGAATLNYAAVTRVLERDGRACGVEVGLPGEVAVRRVHAPCIVACTGPWTNTVLARLRPGTAAAVAPSRGTHIVVRKLVTHGVTLATGEDGRVFFVLPWLGHTLVGTTDVATTTDDADAVAPTAAEVASLLAATNRFFPAARLGSDDVIAAFAGLRPLRHTDGASAARSREHEILEPIPGLFCVVGGKYTTYRAVAQEVVDRVQHRLGRRQPCRTASLPLPGGDVPWGEREQWQEGPAWQEEAQRLAGASGLAPQTVQHLLRVHGTRAERIVALARSRPGAQAQLCPHLPYIAAEVLFAVREEMALRLEDWFFRRSPTAFHPCHGLDAVESVAALYAEELGWSQAAQATACARLEQALRAVCFIPPPPASTPAA